VRRPVAFRITLATSAATSPPRAQTIHDGKYEPRMLREGEPLHPDRVHISRSAHALAKWS
jgi:hypothetical protein